MFGMGAFSVFERSMIRDRVVGVPWPARTTPFKIDRIRAALDEGRGVRETATAAEGARRQGVGGLAHVGDHGQVCTLDRSCQNGRSIIVQAMPMSAIATDTTVPRRYLQARGQ